MFRYLVRWQLEVQADSVFHAAVLAQASMMDADDPPCDFTVQNLDNPSHKPEVVQLKMDYEA